MNIDLIKYLEFLKKGKVPTCIIVENEYTEERIEELYILTIDIFRQLEVLRHSQDDTNKMILSKTTDLLWCTDWIIVYHWLLEATLKDESYVYANRFLVEKLGYRGFDICISDYELFQLLEKEAKQISEDPHSSLKNKEDLEIQEIKSEIREYVKGKVESIDINLHWKYVFFTSDDLNLFMDLMSNFFAGTSYKLPEVINLMPKCKGRFARLLHTIHKKYRQRTPNKIKDQEFFKLVKNFNLFKELTDSQIYNDIARTCDEI